MVEEIDYTNLERFFTTFLKHPDCVFRGDDFTFRFEVTNPTLFKGSEGICVRPSGGLYGKIIFANGDLDNTFRGVGYDYLIIDDVFQSLRIDRYPEISKMVDEIILLQEMK